MDYTFFDAPLMARLCLKKIIDLPGVLHFLREAVSCCSAITHLVLSLVCRSLRKWWVALPDNRRQLLRQWAWQRRWHLAAGAGVAMVIAALLLLTHLDESPVTGRTRLLVFSRENYMELAALTSEAVSEGEEPTIVCVTA